MAFVGLLFSFIGEERGHPLRFCFTWGMTIATFSSWMAAGIAVWATFRMRKRRIIRASILALMVAGAATIRSYLLVFQQ
jgi:hypothetical protein